MTEIFESVKVTDVIKDSLPKLLNRDLTALTFSSGTDWPSEITSDMVGRLVNRTDLQTIYRLKAVNPDVWEPVLNYSSAIPNATTIAATYQPLNTILTLLSGLNGSANQVPYFTSTTSMSTFPITAFGQSVLASANAAAVRSLYGLGTLATKNTVGTSDIVDGSVTEAKLAFTPIRSGEGFLTGDIKEDATSTVANGWINCSGTIGDASSGATYANANAENLFKALWSNQNLSVLPNKGSSAAADWSAHKKIVLPDTSVYSSVYNINLRIKL